MSSSLTHSKARKYTHTHTHTHTAVIIPAHFLDNNLAGNENVLKELSKKEKKETLLVL